MSHDLPRRIAYLLTWRFGTDSGVFHKVRDQVAAWERLGAEVGIFVVTSEQAAADWAALQWSRSVAALRTTRMPSITENRRAHREAIRALQAWAPDITYVRSSPRQFAIARELRALPHVIEIQSDDLAEARLSGGPVGLTIRATRRACLGGARGMVFVSHELAESPSYDTFTAHRIVIGNGVDLDRLAPLPDGRTAGAPPRIFFVGHPGVPWHGLDDLLDLADARPTWTFDIVGPTAGERRQPNVTYYGLMKPSEYLDLLAQADVSVGGLGMHLKGLHEASPLKSRESLACGVPVIAGYRDTDIPDESGLCLRVPNQAGGIVQAVSDVELFIESWRGRRIRHDQITFLDTMVKERQRLAFLAECGDGARSRPRPAGPPSATG